jgi:hypothetical protein
MMLREYKVTKLGVAFDYTWNNSLKKVTQLTRRRFFDRPFDTYTIATYRQHDFIRAP